MEAPVSCGHVAALHFHATSAGRPGASRVGPEGGPARPAWQNHLWAPGWRMAAFQHPPVPLDGMMGLIPERRGHRPTRGFAPRRPARFLVVAPWPHAVAVGRPRRAHEGVRHAAPLLAEGTPPQACVLSTPMPQGIERRAARRADRGREGRECPGELVDRVEQAGAEARPQTPCPDAWDGAVEGLGQAPPDSLPRSGLASGLLTRPLRRGQGRRTLGLKDVAASWKSTVRGRWFRVCPAFFCRCHPRGQVVETAEDTPWGSRCDSSSNS